MCDQTKLRFPDDLFTCLNVHLKNSLSHWLFFFRGPVNMLCCRLFQKSDSELSSVFLRVSITVYSGLMQLLTTSCFSNSESSHSLAIVS